MSLDDEVPDPPTLSAPQTRGEYDAIDVDEADVQDDYRREELEGFLQSGAWADAFGEWGDTTSLTEADLELVVELGLIDRYDFYWDPRTDDVGYIPPTIPEEARSDIDPETVDEIDAELDELGRVVTEVLENDYLLRDDEDEGFGFFADESSDEDLSDGS